jgi:hypothetical protein
MKRIPQEEEYQNSVAAYDRAKERWLKSRSNDDMLILVQCMDRLNCMDQDRINNRQREKAREEINRERKQGGKPIEDIIEENNRLGKKVMDRDARRPSR